VAGNYEAVRQEVTGESLDILSNTCVFPAFIGRDKQEYFEGKVKIGDHLDIKRPIKTTGRVGQAFQPEGLVRTTVPMTIAFWLGYDFIYNDTEEAMFLDMANFKEEYIKPGAVHLANQIDLVMAQYVAATTPNFVGTPGTTPTTLDTYNSAQTKLNQLLAPQDNRVVIYNSAFNQQIVKAGSTVFNPQQIIGKQYLEGKVGRYAGFDVMLDEQIPSSTFGTYTAAGVVDGAGQQGSTILTKTWTACSLVAGDRLTFDGCYEVNPDSRLQVASVKKQWQITANTVDTAGAATLPIYPAMITSGPYQNCSGSPADGAAINLAGTTGVNYTTAIAMQKGAYTAAFIKLQNPSEYGAKSVVMTDPETKITLRMIWQWNSSGPYAGNVTCRMDVIFGIASQYSDYYSCAIYGA
jgi:P22 coat protein - gene protein 5